MTAYEKVSMINNFLVSIVSDKAIQPVINVNLRSLLPEIEEFVKKHGDQDVSLDDADKADS